MHETLVYTLIASFLSLAPGHKLQTSMSLASQLCNPEYAFCSVCQNLPDYLAEIFEIWQNLNLNFCKFLILRHLKKCCWIFKKIQLDNLVDFEKCCKTRIFLQRSASIQPKTSENLRKNWQLPYGSTRASSARTSHQRAGPTSIDHGLVCAIVLLRVFAWEPAVDITIGNITEALWLYQLRLLRLKCIFHHFSAFSDFYIVLLRCSIIV